MQDKHRILTTVSLYHGLNDGAISVIPLLFPILKDLFSLSYTQVGIITGGGFLVTLIAQLFIGRASDRRNFSFLLSIGILLLSLGMLVLTQSRDFITLLLFMFLLRFAAAFFHPIGIGWISRTFKHDRLDWAMGMQSGFGDLGAFIAVFTTLYIADITEWSVPLYLWAIVGIAGMLFGMFLTSNLSDKYTNSVKSLASSFSLKESISDAFVVFGRIKRFILAFITSGASWGVTITFLPLLLAEKTTLPLATIGIIVAMWIGFGTIVSFCYGKIKVLIGRMWVLIIAYLLLGVCSFLLVFFTSTVIIIIAVALLGFGIFLTFPALASFISEITHETVEGKTFAYTFTLQLAGGTVMLFLCGKLADTWGITMPFVAMGILGLCVLVILSMNFSHSLIQH